jgi:WD40 repeat protein
VFLSSGQVTSVAYSPCGKWIASGGGYGDKSVRIWDAATGAAVGSSLRRQCSKDNPKCTCEFYTDEDGDECHDEDQECPVSGHTR